MTQEHYQETMPEWMAELTIEDMATVTGGVLLRRLTLNRWLLKFRLGTLNLTNAQKRVTNDILGDATNRQSSLDLSAQYFNQLTALRGNRRLGDRFFKALGLPTPT